MAVQAVLAAITTQATETISTEAISTAIRSIALKQFYLFVDRPLPLSIGGFAALHFLLLPNAIEQNRSRLSINSRDSF